MAAPHRPRVFLDVNIGAEPAGRLTIELFADKAPRACENFRQLCTGTNEQNLSYARAPFHRVIDDFMIQGGDIEHGDGTGTASIYGGEFEDENLHWRELDASGLVCAANRGTDTNGCQFFMTLAPCPHLNGKHTIFGRLVGGEKETLQRIAKIKVDDNDRPLEPILIARCGELEKQQKKHGKSQSIRNQHQQQRRVAQESSRSNSRGRRRKSGDSEDEEMIDGENENMTERQQQIQSLRNRRRSRRQSDNVVDEGLRGRPRQRSGSHSRSPSAALASSSDDGGGTREDDGKRDKVEGETSESDRRGDDSRSSHPELHKRKRSPSPSRRRRPAAERDGDRDADSGLGNGDADENEFEHETRRRRSLPNQYHANGGQHDRRHHHYQQRDHHHQHYPRDEARYEDEKRYRPSPRRGDEREDHWSRHSGHGYYDGRGRNGYGSGRRHDDGERYRNRRDDRQDNEGRLGGYGDDGDGSGENGPPPAVKFKGRGIMKYREADRAW